MSHPDLVPFRLVYWRAKCSPVIRRASQQVFARGPALLTMCGSTVRNHGRTSTLTLLISVDSELYGLTVDHLFHKNITDSQRDLPEELDTPSEKQPLEADEDDSTQLDVPWTDNATYLDLDDSNKAWDKTTTESFKDDGFEELADRLEKEKKSVPKLNLNATFYESNNTAEPSSEEQGGANTLENPQQSQVATGIRAWITRQDSLANPVLPSPIVIVENWGPLSTKRPGYDVRSKAVTIGRHSWTVQGTKVEPVSSGDASRPYLDWALILFDLGYYRRPNVFYFENDPTPQYIHESTSHYSGYTDARTFEEVFMVSGTTGTRTGILLPGYSYIGSGPGRNLCKVWSLKLSDDIGNNFHFHCHSVFAN